MELTNDTTIEYIANPKRAGFKAHARYELYQAATTIGEYLEIADPKYAKADLRYDLDKGYLIIEPEQEESPQLELFA